MFNGGRDSLSGRVAVTVFVVEVTVMNALDVSVVTRTWGLAIFASFAQVRAYLKTSVNVIAVIVVIASAA